MALVNLKVMLDDANRRGYAVGAFNVVCLESMQAILDAAIECRSPVILNIAEVHFKYVDLEMITPLIRDVAEKVPIPVALHLDHGESFEAIMRAIRCGFTSVMIDCSTLPFEENVERTREVVKMCHAIGVTVEAELGHVGGAEGASEASSADNKFYTDPLEAKKFVEATGVDALAVAIGTAHGLYKAAPKLDFDRLAEIKRLTKLPLVLHGGSGVPDDDFRKAVKLGINKINFYTGMSQAAANKVRSILDSDPNMISFPDLLLAARTAMKETVKERMCVFGSAEVCSQPNSYCSICSACSVPTVAQDLAQNITVQSTSSCGCNGSQTVGKSSTCQGCNACAAKGNDTKQSSDQIVNDLSDEELSKIVTKVAMAVLNEGR